MTPTPNTAPAPLPSVFYLRPAPLVARELLGARLIRHESGVGRIVGKIVETEAYSGVDDLASHARHQRTPRNRPMWEQPGRAYIYQTYGMHWMLNAVAEPEDIPAAVLIRAVEPLDGLEIIAARRKDRRLLEWTSGPARVAMAFNITGSLNRADLTTPDAGLWIEAGQPVPDSDVRTGPRVRIGQTPEPWLSIPWRFYIAEHPHVSR